MLELRPGYLPFKQVVEGSIPSTLTYIFPHNGERFESAAGNGPVYRAGGLTVP